LPFSDQSNYTAGAVYKSYRRNGFFMVTGSRSELKNSAEKYYNNDASNDAGLLLKYNSREWSHRARAEYTHTAENFKWNSGVSWEDVHGEFDVFTRIVNEFGDINVNYFSPVGFQNYAAFTQLSKGWLNDKITATIGGRADGSTYNSSLKNPLENLSGRANVSFNLFKGFALQTGIANYFQLPSMMTLSYRNSGMLDNQQRTQFVESIHYTAGIKWDTPISSRLSIEGFYKRYPNYLMSLRDSISIAHVPADFGVFGNYPVSFDSKGRAYGAEFLYQQRLYKGFYGMVSYTLSWSEYLDKRNEYVASAWDARHVVSLTLGKRFGTQWEAGLNWRYQSAIPYTPFNEELSAQRLVWDVNNAGIRDFDRLHELRGKSTSILNLRVDRIYNFKEWKNFENKYIAIETKLIKNYKVNLYNERIDILNNNDTTSTSFALFFRTFKNRNRFVSRSNAFEPQHAISYTKLYFYFRVLTYYAYIIDKNKLPNTGGVTGADKEWPEFLKKYEESLKDFDKII
jgi:hypothetical protein